MSAWTPKLLTTCLLCAWLLAPMAVNAQIPSAQTEEVDIATLKPPPRDVKDVLRVLETSKIDMAEVERARAIVAAPAPEAGADGKTLNAYHVRRALALQKLGNLSDAVVSMRLAALDHPLNEPRFQVRDLVDLAAVESFAGNGQRALRALEKAKPLAEQHRMGGWILSINRLLVANHAAMGNFEAAKTLLLETDSLLVSFKRSPRLADFITIWESNLETTYGIYYASQGQWVESERANRKALRLLYKAYEDAKKNAKPVDELAGGERTFTDGTNNTRNYITQILTRHRALSDVLLQQRKLVDAEHHARESLSMALDNFGRNSSHVGQALAQLSRVISEQGRQAEALLLARASLQAYVESGVADNSSVMALGRKFHATALVSDGQYQQADRVFNEMMAGVRRNPVLEKNFRADDLDWVLAMQKVGKQQEAEAMAARMRQRQEERSGKDAPRTAMVTAFHAASLQKMGRWKEAQAAYQQAVPILMDQVRNDAENDTNSIKQQQRMTYLLESYLALLAHVARTEPAQAQAAAVEAFTVADLTKGSGVQRALTASAARASIKDPQLAQLARKEQDLQRRVNSLSELLTGLLSAPPEQQLPSVQAKIRQDVAGFKAERNTLKKDIEHKYPDYAEMVEPKPATVERTQKLLRPDEVLVSWYFGEQEGYVWAISRQGVPLFKSVPLGRARMAQQVAHLRKALDPGVATIDEIPPFDVAAAHALYQQLLAPVSEAFKGKRVMLVVPHAELGQLPLSVLVTQAVAAPAKDGVPFAGYRSVPWLARDIAIAQLPSVTALTALRNLPPGNPRRKSFIGFGDPFFSAEQQKSAVRPAATQLATRGVPLNLRSAPKTGGVSSAELALLPRLPDTQQELQEIGRVLAASADDLHLHQRASVKAVLSADLSNRKVVMFATHGLVPGELDGLTQPALALSSPEVTGDKDDGLLTMDKVLSLKLDADWVVLSACNTASGEGAGSEAVSGLGRAFFFAGARALLVSNWPVDSPSARQLMTDLFKRQQAAAQPPAKPEALRQAMLHLIDHGGMGTTRYAYAHPLFWAPFVVVGD